MPIENAYLLKFIQPLARLLDHQVFVSVKVDRSTNPTKYIIKIKNNYQKDVTIVRLIANPGVLSKNRGFTDLNGSKCFQNQVLPPGESIDFPFSSKDVENVRQTFLFKAEYIVKLMGFYPWKRISKEYSFSPINNTVTIGTSVELPV